MEADNNGSLFAVTQRYSPFIKAIGSSEPTVDFDTDINFGEKEICRCGVAKRKTTTQIKKIYRLTVCLDAVINSEAIKTIKSSI